MGFGEAKSVVLSSRLADHRIFHQCDRLDVRPDPGHRRIVDDERRIWRDERWPMGRRLKGFYHPLPHRSLRHPWGPLSSDRSEPSASRRSVYSHWSGSDRRFGDDGAGSLASKASFRLYDSLVASRTPRSARWVAIQAPADDKGSSSFGKCCLFRVSAVFLGQTC